MKKWSNLRKLWKTRSKNKINDIEITKLTNTQTTRG